MSATDAASDSGQIVYLRMRLVQAALILGSVPFLFTALWINRIMIRHLCAVIPGRATAMEFGMVAVIMLLIELPVLCLIWLPVIKVWDRASRRIRNIQQNEVVAAK